jgi:hypothetical protein
MSFKNPLLTKLLEGVLQNREVHIRTDLLPVETIMDAVDLLPLSLSERQRAAIVNAWQSEISYVQGPPGTGKSHTITAIMLTALFLRQRVLMVSHKKPAVEIVRHMLKKHLGPGGVVYLGPTAAQRRALRGELQGVCQNTDTLQGARRLKALSENTERQENQTRLLQTEVRNLQERLKQALEREKHFYVKHEAFLKHRTQFAKDFDIDDETVIKLAPRVQNRVLYQGHLSRAQQLLETELQASAGFLARKDWLFLRRFFKTTVESYYADSSRLAPDANAAFYLQEHFNLTLAYEDAVNARHKITDDFLMQVRRSLLNNEQKLKTAKEELIRAKFVEHVADHVRDSFSDVEKFGRILHWRDPRRIVEIMDSIDYGALTETFPLWVGEMRHLGEFLPFLSELFDLVIVDESSQVNIAEIIPAFYRGKRFCVVGDKQQLGLSSVGLFALNRTFEELTWGRHFAQAGVTCTQAGDRSVLVSKSAILDFITSGIFRISQATLNEHFRSMPQLASFTSEQFYQADGGLLLMKEVPKNIHKQCFEAIEVGGLRDAENKIVPKEVEELLRRLKFLICESGYAKDEKLKAHEFTDEQPPTIGVISILTDQRNYIQTLIEENFSKDEIERHDLMVGTPEDFQGNERHIIFLTLGLDGTNKYGISHYRDEKRFNVATSRAINFTYVIYGRIPQSAHLIKKYLQHFGATWSTTADAEPTEAVASPTMERYRWRYHPDCRESKFEIVVDDYLQKFIGEHGGHTKIHFYNQVKSCGQKRLDFVLFNKENGKCCAVEVDGRDHYRQDGRSYSDAHLERVAVLRRAGWEIVHVPYYHWYRDGWLCDRDGPQFQKMLGQLFAELKLCLALA